MAVVWDEGVNTGRLTPSEFVAVTSANAARLFNIYPRKGCIAPGADADIAIWDPGKRVTFGVNDLHDNTGYNPFAGHSVTGWPETVLSRGEVVIGNGKLCGSPGRGQRVRMAVSQAMRPARGSEGAALGTK